MTATLAMPRLPFPARLTKPDGEVLRTVRAVLVERDDGRVLRVFVAAGRRAELVHEVEILSDGIGEAPRGTVVLVDGEFGKWTIERGGGCGCGSPLKSMSAAELLGGD